MDNALKIEAFVYKIDYDSLCASVELSYDDKIERRFMRRSLLKDYGIVHEGQRFWIFINCDQWRIEVLDRTEDMVLTRRHPDVNLSKFKDFEKQPDQEDNLFKHWGK
ncbi:MAG: hypothetical protein HC888_03985 [Candidatus Competibacteraceae bacterium]|nr:hypothetical protein [Candidatus Competibacteraceae bacterium]